MWLIRQLQIINMLYKDLSPIWWYNRLNLFHISCWYIEINTNRGKGYFNFSALMSNKQSFLEYIPTMTWLLPLIGNVHVVSANDSKSNSISKYTIEHRTFIIEEYLKCFKEWNRRWGNIQNMYYFLIPLHIIFFQLSSKRSCLKMSLFKSLLSTSTTSTHGQILVPKLTKTPGANIRKRTFGTN